MHRLSRSLHCPRALARRTLARVERVQPSHSSIIPLTILRRHYATSNRPIPAREKFPRLLASLGEKLPEDDLFMTIAGLIITSKRNKKRYHEAMQSIMHYMYRHNMDTGEVDKRVKELLKDPPKDEFEEFVNRISPSELAKTNPTPYDELPDNPSLEHPYRSLQEHLRQDNVQLVIKSLLPWQQEEIASQMQKVSEDPDNMDHLIETAELLAEYDLPVRFERRVSANTEKLGLMEGYYAQVRQEAIEEEDEAAIAELEQRIKDNEQSEREEEARREAEAAQKQKEKEEEETRRIAKQPQNLYPNLMTPDPILDSRDVLELPPEPGQPFHNRVIVRNHSSIFNEALIKDGANLGSADYEPTKTDQTEESASSLENLPFTAQELKSFYTFRLILRRVTQQTGKGKIHRFNAMTVVGNGDGMVGLGSGKDEDATRAEQKAFAQAVRNMDWVERFEKRTIWTDMESKLGSTRLYLRPRPVGFGLRCNPNLHQVLKAAGIKDISAKVWGSRNPINVIKAVFRMLQAGHAPLGMGDGIGGRGKKMNKGSGLRSKDDVERERGRQLINLRK